MLVHTYILFRAYAIVICASALLDSSRLHIQPTKSFRH